MNTDLCSEMRRLVVTIAAMPYVWPGEPTADAARESGTGTCASKHALLAEELAAIGIESRPTLASGALIPRMWIHDPIFSEARELLEVHELLTVSVPGVGPCRVDVTWDPPLIRAGLPGQVDWDGASDMTPAIGETTNWWSPHPQRLREEKEALRSRLYGPGDRQVRDDALETLSQRFVVLRQE